MVGDPLLPLIGSLSSLSLFARTSKLGYPRAPLLDPLIIRSLALAFTAYSLNRHVNIASQRARHVRPIAERDRSRREIGREHPLGEAVR